MPRGDVAVGYWPGVELISGLVQGAILGVRKYDLQACQIQRLVLAVHCFVMAAASLILRPCGSFFANLFFFASNLGSFVVSLLIVIHTVSGSEGCLLPPADVLLRTAHLMECGGRRGHTFSE